MTDALFHEAGREGNLVDAHQFEQRARSGLAAIARWTVVASNVDAFLPAQRRSRGLDGIWALTNPRTGRGDGWVVEFKRHDGPGRYTTTLLGHELSTLRTKAALLRQRGAAFFDDPQIAPHVQHIAGGILMHHCRGFSAGRARRILRDLTLEGAELGPRPLRLLFVGPDDLGAVGAAVQRFGAPIDWWWPATPSDASAWHASMPPEQLAAGMLVFRTAEHGRVLLLRDGLERRDVDAVAELAWRYGGNFDVVACASMRSEQARFIADAWRHAVRRCGQRPHGHLPAHVVALDCAEPIAHFESAFTPDGPVATAAPPKRIRRRETPGPPPISPATPAESRRRTPTAYPSRVAVQQTLDNKATLRGALAWMAGEGIVVMAHEKHGAAIAGGEIWTQPQSIRRMGDLLEEGAQPSVSGLRLKQAATQPTLPTLGRMSVFDELSRASEGLVDAPVGDRRVRLRSQQTGDGPWPLELDLVYEDTYDLIGERVVQDAHVSLLVRPIGESEVDVCILADDPADRAAARQWITSGLSLTEREWRLIEVALPASEPHRTATLAEVVEAACDGAALGVNDPHGDRDRGTVRPAPLAVGPDDDAEGLRELDERLFGTRDLCDIVSLRAVLARARHNHQHVSELTAFAKHNSAGTVDAIVAMRLRQPPRTAYLSLMWKGGRRHNAQTRGHSFGIDVWTAMDPLGLTRDDKRRVLAGRWADVAERIRQREALTTNGLRKSA